MSSRHLVVLRHAKAEPYASADHSRSLTARGRADAAETGRYLASCGILPDFALLSSAVRAVQTWEHVREAASVQAQERVEDRLYGASSDTILESVRETPSEASTVILVGHNPDLEEFARMLADDEGDVDLLQSLLAGLPTSGCAVFEVSGEWGDLGPDQVRLTRFHVARG